MSLYNNCTLLQTKRQIGLETRPRLDHNGGGLHIVKRQAPSLATPRHDRCLRWKRHGNGILNKHRKSNIHHLDRGEHVW